MSSPSEGAEAGTDSVDPKIWTRSFQTKIETIKVARQDFLVGRKDGMRLIASENGNRDCLLVASIGQK